MDNASATSLPYAATGAPWLPENAALSVVIPCFRCGDTIGASMAAQTLLVSRDALYFARVSGTLRRGRRVLLLRLRNGFGAVLP